MGNATQHRVKKRFGQHFLTDRAVIQRIVQAIHPQPGESLIEIGPGDGALTFPLLKLCHELTAIELDRDLIPRLKSATPKNLQLHLVNQDVLNFSFDTLDLPRPLRLAGNLPYNISTPLMFHLLKFSDDIQDMHFMVQKEVAERIVATPGGSNSTPRQYGRLSIMMQYQCSVEYLFDVPPDSFTPPPEVDSSVIRLKPVKRSKDQQTQIETLNELTVTAFSQRRKTLANTLKKIISKDDLIELGIDPGLRPENLAINDFIRLSQHLERKRKSQGSH